MSKYLVIPVLMIAWSLPGQVEPAPAVEVGAAPPAGKLRVGGPVDLGGSWDDVYAPRGADHLLLRSGAKLLKVPLHGRAEPVEWRSAAELERSKIVADVRVDGVLWLLLDSTTRGPFAWSPERMQRLDFPVPGLETPPDRPPTLQSWVVAPHAGSVVLMISGGERSKWPRDGNRPVYFWAGLGRGEVVRMPLGYDLDYLSPDRSRAVFEVPGERRWRHVAIDLATGREVTPVPPQSIDGWVAFDWENRDRAQPIVARRGRDTCIVGIAGGGGVVDLGLEIGSPYIPRAMLENGWWGLHTRGHGRPRATHHSLWFGPAAGEPRPVLLGDDVSDWAIAGDGLCVFTVTGGTTDGTSRSRTEPFVYDAERGVAWRALDGVERLKPLEPKLRAEPGVADVRHTRILRGTDVAAGPGLTLLFCQHDRGDMRHRTVGMAPLLPSERWRTLVLITGDGRRFVAREPDLPDPRVSSRTWLFDTGRLFYTEPHVAGIDAPRRLRLSMVDLTWPE